MGEIRTAHDLEHVHREHLFREVEALLVEVQTMLASVALVHRLEHAVQALLVLEPVRDLLQRPPVLDVVHALGLHRAEDVVEQHRRVPEVACK